MGDIWLNSMNQLRRNRMIFFWHQKTLRIFSVSFWVFNPGSFPRLKFFPFCTPLKINMGSISRNYGGLVQIIFLSKWVIWRFHVNLPGCIDRRYEFLEGSNFDRQFGFLSRNLFGRRAQDSSLFVRSMHSCCFSILRNSESYNTNPWANFFKNHFPKNFFPTVGGRNLAPVDMVNIRLFTGFYTSQVM